MNDTDWNEKAFAFASDVTKQLITLATGVVTVTITFSQNILFLAAGKGRGILTGGWIALLASILAGLLTLLSLTGQLGTGNASTPPDIWAGGVRMFSILQIVAFLVGVAFAVWYVVYALGQPVTLPKK